METTHKYKKLSDWYKVDWNILVNEGSHQLVKIYPDGTKFFKKSISET